MIYGVVCGLDPGLICALTPYLLVFGSFSYPLFKVFNISRFWTRIYGFIYVVLASLFTFPVYLETLDGNVYTYYMAGFPPPIGITYVIDNLNSFLALLVSLLVLVSYPLMKNYVEDNEYFYAMLLAFEAGLLGVLYTGDVFNLFVMLELTLIASYSLIASYGRASSYKSAFKYAMIAGVSGMIFFLSTILYYNVLGTLNIGHGAAIVESITPPIGRSDEPLTALHIVLTIMLWSLLVETALVPLHFWLPDAYSSAPPPIAGLLAGLSEGVGFYVLIRLYYVLLGGFDQVTSLVLGVLGILSIFVGGFGMIFSNNLLKIISYSVVLDAGYMGIALSLGVNGVYIVLSYILAHTIVKPLLFITSGYVVHKRGTPNLDKLRGVLRSSPILQLGFLIGAIAVVGVPPTILFQAKLQLYIEALSSIDGFSLYPVIALIVMVMGSIMAFTGFARAFYSTLFMHGELVEKPRGYMVFFIVLFSTLVIVLGIIYGYLYDNVIMPAGLAVIQYRFKYIKTVVEGLGWLKW